MIRLVIGPFEMETLTVPFFLEIFTEEEIFFWDGFMGITRLSFVDRKAHGAFTFFDILAQYIVECQPLNTRFTFVKESLISYSNFLCPDEDEKRQARVGNELALQVIWFSWCYQSFS